MSEQERPIDGKGKVATIIDSNFAKAAATIDNIRLNLMDQGEAGENAVPFVGGIADKLGSASERLRKTNGEDVVEYAKTQIEKHPALLTVAIAAAGAAAAQIAVAAVRRERNHQEQQSPELQTQELPVA